MTVPKFRAWDKKNKEMLEVEDMAWSGGVFGGIGDAITFWRSAKEIVLMQSTGFKDKNGEEIFEGDILKNKNHHPSITFVCKKSNSQASFRAYSKNGFNNIALWYDESADWTVIGNIYENPDLLEELNDQYILGGSDVEEVEK